MDTLNSLHFEAFETHWELYGNQYWSHQGENFKAIHSAHKTDTILDGAGLELVEDTHAFSVSTPRCIFPSALLNESGRCIIRDGEFLTHDGADYQIKKVLDNKEVWIRFILKTAD